MGKAIENTECSIPKISTGLSCILTELYSCQEQTTTETQGCWTEKMCRLSQKVKMLCSIFVMRLYELPSNCESRERRDSHRSEMPDPLWPLQNCHMFWCELQVDIFWMSVQSITCGILACSLLDQMSSDPSKNRIHHGQQLGSVINQRAGALRALTATKTFAANKPSLPAGAVKGPELLTGSGSHTSSPGKCHLKFWKCHLWDFLAQRHITHPAPSLELKRQPWHRIAAPEGWDTYFLHEKWDRDVWLLDTTFQVRLNIPQHYVLSLIIFYSSAHATHGLLVFMSASYTILFVFATATHSPHKIYF